MILLSRLYLICSLNKSNTHLVNCVVWAVINFHHCMLFSDQNIIGFHYYRSVWWCVISAAWEVFRKALKLLDTFWSKSVMDELPQTDWEMDLTSLFSLLSSWGAGMAQWWEHSPSTNVTRVRFPDSASYVGWVCRFSTPHREVFSGYSGFPSPQKPTFDLIYFHC